MNDWIQWGITTIVGILGIIIGREWKKKENRSEKDKETLKLILKILPSNGTISYLRQHDFSGSYDVDRLNDLFNIIDQSTNPELTFINDNLEKIKKDLLQSMITFNYKLGTEAFPINAISQNRNRIPRPEEIGDEKFKLLRETINNLSNQVCVNYDKLVKVANRNLWS